MITEAFLDDTRIHRTGDLALSKFDWAPVPRETRANRSAAHGEIDRTRWYSGSIFNLEGFARGRTAREAHQALDRLKAALQLRDAPVLLRFRREGDFGLEQAWVRQASRLDYELRPSRLIRWSVQLLAADPRVYSATLQTVSYDPTEDDPETGLRFPLTFPLVFGAGPDSTIPAVNAGDTATPPTFVIRGPAVNPIVDNDTVGRSIYTRGLELGAEEEIHLDVANRRALLGGVTSRPDLIDPARTYWSGLAPGENRIRLRGSGFVNGQTLLTASWRDARL